VLRAAKRLNRAALLRALARPRLVYAAVALLSAPRLARRSSRGLPAPLQRGHGPGHVSFRPGISLAESARLGAVAERLVSGAEVASVGRRTGRAELDEHAEACT
jgi:HME family heavy-metal exporter